MSIILLAVQILGWILSVGFLAAVVISIVVDLRSKSKGENRVTSQLVVGLFAGGIFFFPVPLMMILNPAMLVFEHGWLLLIVCIATACALWFMILGEYVLDIVAD